MIILWIQKNKNAARNKDVNEPFKEHDEVMKKFRLAHAEIKAITDKDIDKGNRNLLAPVCYVRLDENARN